MITPWTIPAATASDIRHTVVGGRHRRPRYHAYRAGASRLERHQEIQKEMESVKHLLFF